MTGKVKWFGKEKGFGFIVSDAGDDYFFNVQGVKGAELPSSGDTVTFDPKSGNKGPRADNVTIISKAEPEKTSRNDDRISCPSCGKKIVPRMITYRGRPDKSVCPYCASTVKEFNKGCYIATSVYGNTACYQVVVLRYYRDQKLLKNTIGRSVVRAYYKISPTIASWLSGTPRVSARIRYMLDRIVDHIVS